MPGARAIDEGRGGGAAERPRLTIALLNNMPDAALAATERQFTSLLAEAAGEAFEVKLRLYAFGATRRGELVRAQMADTGYDPAEALMALGADGLIVTGAEPQAATLSDEPYWPELARLIDWAAQGGVRSAVFSCLAAHAAVLHLDGIERRRLSQKTTGVFAFQRAAPSPLTHGLGDIWRTPHSRWNAVDPEALTARGYAVLAASPEIGVDVFSRDLGALFVFLQGHPEYDGDSLLREYRRDLGRWARGELVTAPRPQGYFDPALDAALDALAEDARLTGQAAPIESCARMAGVIQPLAPWRPQAVQLYRNWLECVADAKAGFAAEPVAADADLLAQAAG